MSGEGINSSTEFVLRSQERARDETGEAGRSRFPFLPPFGPFSGEWQTHRSRSYRSLCGSSTEERKQRREEILGGK
jgi:hypothetical protein